MSNVPPISWKSAASLSGLAVYGPFMVMAIYALLFVSCSHCKTAAWTLLPCAPGLLSIEAGRQLLNLGRPADLIGFGLAFTVSLAMIFGLACLIRRGRRLGLAGVSVALAVFSIIAFCTLSMIRS